MKVVYQGELGNFNESYFEDLELDIENEIFLKSLVEVINNKDDVVTNINTHLKDWNYNRLGILERSVLLLGFYELKNFDDIPFKVTIDEWVDLAKEFCGEEAKKLINGVLNSYKNELFKKAEN